MDDNLEKAGQRKPEAKEKKTPVIRQHRKGQVYIENGNALTWSEKEPFKIPKHIKGQLQYTKHNDPVEFRELAAQVTVEMVRYLVTREGQPIELSKVYQQGAYLLKVSPETIKRYIFTFTAEGAELLMVGKRVTVNPNFEAEDE